MQIAKLVSAVMLVGMQFQVAPQPVNQPEPSTVEVVQATVDPRIEKLNSFFAKYKCPTPYRSEKYLEVADKHNLPYTLLPVISLKESTCGKQVFRKNNWWGYGSNSFDTWEGGLEFIADKLANGRYYKGKTLEKKLGTYNSVNPQYVPHALSLMKSIE